MSTLESKLSSNFNPKEIKELEAIKQYGTDFYNFLLNTSVPQDKYKITHLGFKEMIRNEHIWSNYIHAAVLGQAKLLIPTSISEITSITDYFTQESADVFDKYVTTLHKLFNTPTYRKLLMIGMGTNPNIKK